MANMLNKAAKSLTSYGTQGQESTVFYYWNSSYFRKTLPPSSFQPSTYPTLIYQKFSFPKDF